MMSGLERAGSTTKGLQRANSSKAVPQDVVARWSDVRVLRLAGADIGAGVDRRYAMTLVSTGTVLALHLTRPSLISAPGATDASSKLCIQASGVAQAGPRRAAFDAGATVVELATRFEATQLLEAVGAAGTDALDLDLADVATQRYVAELLLDPRFEDFVRDMGDFVNRLRAPTRAAASPRESGPADDDSVLA